MKVLISQQVPSNLAPYEILQEKFGAELDFHPFFLIEPLSAREFRAEHINLPDYTAIVFSSRHAIDAYFKLCEELRYKVEHDALTELYNRGAYEKLLETHQAQGDIALLWIDVDKFKGINDTYGHDIGDKILQKVARKLAEGFRNTDYACRTGGDEFAVIMTDVTPEQQQAVLRRVEAVQAGLRDVRDGLPEVTLSIGIAFSKQRKEGELLFKMADKALYRVKEAGRNGCAIFNEEDRNREIE